MAAHGRYAPEAPLEAALEDTSESTATYARRSAQRLALAQSAACAGPGLADRTAIADRI